MAPGTVAGVITSVTPHPPVNRIPQVACAQCPFSLDCLGGRMTPRMYAVCMDCGLVRIAIAIGTERIVCNNLELLQQNNPTMTVWWRADIYNATCHAHYYMPERKKR